VKERAVELVELGEQARRALARRHPEVTRHGVVLAVGARDELRDVVTRAIEEVVEAANSGWEVNVESIVQRMLETDTAPAADAEDARRRATLRTRVVRDFGTFAGKISRRWKKEGQVFGVPYQGDTVYLSFQFDKAGQPLPIVREVLAALNGWSPWDVAEWFVLRNRRLERRRPAELLEADPDAVAAAARFDGGGPRRDGERGAGLRFHAVDEA
jgi:hypothetical protein